MDAPNIEVDLCTSLTHFDDFPGMRHWHFGLTLVECDDAAEGGERRLVVGKGDVVTLSRRQIAADDVYEALDSVDEDASRIVQALFADEEGEEAIQQVSEDFSVCGGLLYVDQLFIAPEHRGNGYGLDAMNQLLELFADMGVTLAVCYPAPFEERAGVARADAIASLQRYWSQAGFVEIRDDVFAQGLREVATDF